MSEDVICKLRDGYLHIVALDDEDYEHFICGVDKVILGHSRSTIIIGNTDFMALAKSHTEVVRQLNELTRKYNELEQRLLTLEQSSRDN